MHADAAVTLFLQPIQQSCGSDQVRSSVHAWVRLQCDTHVCTSSFARTLAVRICPQCIHMTLDPNRPNLTLRPDP